MITPAHANLFSWLHPNKNKSKDKEDIKHNTADIKTNNQKISTNAAGIRTNQQNISTNAAGIKTNQQNISTNAAGIRTNQQNISTNGIGIQANKQNIGTNTAVIEANRKEIGANIVRAEVNRNDINHNRSAIAANYESTLHNHELVTDNAHAIQTVTGQLNTFKFEAESRFSNIENDIRKNDKKAMAGISAAMAMNAIPFIEGKNVSMGLSGGSYGGQSALAWGAIFKLGDNVRSGTYLSYDTSKNLGAAAGFSVGW
ncbi:YadA C-terminal domain-containing protein [Pantoea dispersa]|uniref:YadA C-terminal domain-containing protein n=1 Tax=Pantoea dispersa TaxID=59814 RepID=UPI00398958E5